jgi:NDP-sugar pyrophosphorylase family protein
MCTGYLADQIELKFEDGQAWDVAIEYSRELSPMGTAGAIKLAEEHLRGASEFLVMNGDSFLEVDLAQLVRFHREHEAVASIAAVSVNDASRYGTITAKADGRVVGFTEKSGCELPGLINGGVYVLNRSALGYFPEGPASLEKDIFPLLLSQGLFAAEQNGIFIDIGTPDDYKTAQELHDRLYAAAENPSRSQFVIPGTRLS